MNCPTCQHDQLAHDETGSCWAYHCEPCKPVLVTLEDAAEQLKTTPTVLRKLAESGKIRVESNGFSGLMIHAADLQREKVARTPKPTKRKRGRYKMRQEAEQRERRKKLLQRRIAARKIIDEVAAPRRSTQQRCCIECKRPRWLCEDCKRCVDCCKLAALCAMMA